MIFLLLAATLFATPERPIAETRQGVASLSGSDPDTVSASNGQTMLIAWQDFRGGQAVRIDAAGHRLDEASIGLPTIPQAVFWNGDHWVIVNRFNFARMSADGRLIDRVARPLELPVSINSTVHGAAWCGSAAIVVTSDRDRNNLIAWRYDRDMNLTGQTELDSWASFVYDNTPLGIASNGSSALVVYRPDDGLDLHVARFDRYGQLERDQFIERATDWRYIAFRAAIGTDGDRYAIVFAHDTNARVFRGFILDGDFKRRSIASFGVSEDRLLSAAVASNLAFDGNVWTAYCSISGHNREEIRAIRIALNGSILDRDPVRVSEHEAVYEGVNFAPRPHVQSAGGTTALVYGVGVKTLAKVKVGTSAEAIAAAPAADLSIGSFVQSGPVVATSATQSLVAWREVLVPSGVPAVLATRVGTNANVIDPQSILIGGSACRESRMAAASDGRDFLVAWEETHAIGGAIVRADGSTVPVRIFNKGLSGGSCAIYEVVAASNGSSYLVGWQTPAAKEGDYDVSAVRVAADGTVLDAQPLMFVAEALVRVASDGRDFLITSGDEARRIGSDGTLDPRSMRLDGQSWRAWWNGTAYVIAFWDQKASGLRLARLGNTLEESAPAVQPPAGSLQNAVCDAHGCSFAFASQSGSLFAGRIEDQGDRFTIRYDPVTATYPAGDGKLENLTLAGGLLIYSRRVLDEGNATRVFLSQLATMRGRAVRKP